MFFWKVVCAISHQDKAVCNQVLYVAESVHSTTEVSPVMHQWVLRCSETGLGLRTNKEKEKEKEKVGLTDASSDLALMHWLSRGSSCAARAWGYLRCDPTYAKKV